MSKDPFTLAILSPEDGSLAIHTLSFEYEDLGMLLLLMQGRPPPSMSRARAADEIAYPNEAIPTCVASSLSLLSTWSEGPGPSPPISADCGEKAKLIAEQ